MSAPSATTATAGAILCAFVALAVAYNAAVPPFEGADESTHYFFAKHVYCTGTLPVQQADAEDRGLWEQEGSQPPLYYALVSPILRWGEASPPSLFDFCRPSRDNVVVNDQNSMGRPAVLGNENRFVQQHDFQGNRYARTVRAIRLASTLLALLTLLALWSIFARLFTPRRWLAVAALALVALNPQFIHLSSTVSNDNAMNALAAVSLALLLRVIDVKTDVAAVATGQHPFTRHRTATAAALALAVGLAPLAKITGLVLAAFVVATLLWTAWRRRVAAATNDAETPGAATGDFAADPGARADARHLIATAAAVVLACLVLAGWWYLRNIRLYGSLTGLNIMLPPELRRDLNPVRFLRGLPAELYGLWLSSWGIFGWFTILLPTWVYRLIDAAALAAVAGGVLSWRRRRDRRPVTPAPALGEGSARTARRGLGAAPTVALLVIWWLLTFAALLRWMLIAKGAHGRLLFPAIAAPAVLLVLGWRALAPARRVGDRTLALAVSGAMAALAVGALVGAIRPAYAMPRSIAPDALPSDTVPIGVVFDGVFELAAMRVPERVVEGTDVDVTLYWRIGDHKHAEFDDLTRDGYVALRWDQEVAAAEPPWVIGTVSSAPDLSYPGRGNAPFVLLNESDMLVEDVRTIRVPALATQPDRDGHRPSTLARLVVDVYDMHAGESWPSAPAADGGPSVAAVDVALDAAARPSLGALPDRRAVAVFDGGLALRLDEPFGGEPVPVRGPWWKGDLALAPALEPIEVPAQDAATIRRLDMTWRVDRAPVDDLSMFVHLVEDDGALADENGTFVASFDGPPARWSRYPTSSWRAGEVVPTFVTWSLPSTALPGDRYFLIIGLYRPIDGTPRLPAVSYHGQRWTDDAVRVAQIWVR